MLGALLAGFDLMLPPMSPREPLMAPAYVYNEWNGCNAAICKPHTIADVDQYMSILHDEGVPGTVFVIFVIKPLKQ